jgi:anti-sigma regulatory factor (Ser/Thr protein kinase)
MAQPDADTFVPGEDPGRCVLLSIPSRMEMLAVVDSLVQAIVSQLDLDEDTAIAIATSVVEAGTNAIQHGHAHDEARPVRFRFVLGDAALDVWVRDTGAGFDPSSILASDPTSPEDILKARGHVGSYQILELLGIGPGESEAIKAVSRQLEELEKFNLIKADGKGWQWIT